MYFDDEKELTNENNEDSLNEASDTKEADDSKVEAKDSDIEPAKKPKGHSHVDNEAKVVEQHSRILEYLKSEHKWENYVLLVLSFMALILGCLIINGTLQVSEEFPLIGNFPRIFAWVLIGLSVLAIALSVWPFFKPAFPELKKVSWPKGRQFAADTARVFIFLLILVFILLLFDAFISRLIKFILGLND